MNKIQKNAIAETLTRLLHKLDSCEERLNVANKHGDIERAERLEARINSLAAELKGADEVLNMLGYVRLYHCDGENEYYTIEKV